MSQLITALFPSQSLDDQAVGTQLCVLSEGTQQKSYCYSTNVYQYFKNVYEEDNDFMSYLAHMG